MAKYTRRPTMVDAVQYTGYNSLDIASLIGSENVIWARPGASLGIRIGIRLVIVDPGSWVIRHSNGYTRIRTAEQFELSYERVHSGTHKPSKPQFDDMEKAL